MKNEYSNLYKYQYLEIVEKTGKAGASSSKDNSISDVVEASYITILEAENYKFPNPNIELIKNVKINKDYRSIYQKALSDKSNYVKIRIDHYDISKYSSHLKEIIKNAQFIYFVFIPIKEFEKILKESTLKQKSCIEKLKSCNICFKKKQINKRKEEGEDSLNKIYKQGSKCCFNSDIKSKTKSKFNLAPETNSCDKSDSESVQYEDVGNDDYVIVNSTPYTSIATNNLYIDVMGQTYYDSHVRDFSFSKEGSFCCELI